MSSKYGSNSFLSSLCRDGKLAEVQDYFNSFDDSAIILALNTREKPLNYTLMHIAALNDHVELLKFLLSKGADPNIKAYNDWTVLHLAASNNRIECVKILLQFSVDPLAVDKYGRTPRTLTILEGIQQLLINKEIVKAAEIGADIQALLSGNSDHLHLDQTSLCHALIEAVRNQHLKNVSELLNRRVSINQALDIAVNERDVYPTLLLLKAAVDDDCTIIKQVYTCGKKLLYPDWVSASARNGDACKLLPLQIANQMGHNSAKVELLLRTGIQGTAIDWSEKQLVELKADLFERISFAETLFMNGNSLKALPSMHCLRLVVVLHLHCNELSSVPPSVFQLPSLKELNLSNNKLTSLPSVGVWPSSLSSLNLSCNKLSTIPGEPIATGVHTLNLANNEFKTVPLCICNFKGLKNLDLSDNKNIISLPAQMGKLKELTVLNLRGLNLNDPPKNVQKSASDCISYLRNKLQSAKGYYRMKLMLVGKQNRGKTTLVARLQGRECGNVSTVGVDISEWEYKPALGKKPFCFSVWDFGGQEEYYSTHQCFLSECSLYLLVFNLKHDREGVKELKLWLNAIALRAPRSCVFIIGTHLDQIPQSDRSIADQCLYRAAELAALYSHRLEIKGVLGVGLKNELENITVLRDNIYHCAKEFEINKERVMGQVVPASYCALDRYFLDMQKEIRSGIYGPIMHKEEYKAVLCKMDVCDIDDEDEVNKATHFLISVGTILHYDDRSHNLDELYFIDPQWLCDIMAKVVTIREKNPFVVDGVLHVSNIPLLLRDETFPAKYFKHYLALLDRFEIAISLDNEKILIPSLLPEKNPEGIDIREINGEPLHVRCILLSSCSIPPGFWSRLLSRVMHFVPQLRFIFTKVINSPNDVALAPCEADDDIPNSVLEDTLSCDDQSQVRVQYWRTGLFYQDQVVTFRIESLLKSKYPIRENKDGILVMASPNQQGRTILTQLVDLTLLLFKDWYQGGDVEQIAPCYECIKMKRALPYEFKVEACLSLVTENKSTIQCCYSQRDSIKNHEVSLHDIVPDLLLSDLSPQYLLKASEITYEESKASLLGSGGYGKVYRGVCKQLSVAVKKYCTSAFEAFSELRREAVLLQKFSHPCLVSLVGVCVHPTLALVLEEAPLGSLEKPLLKTKQPIHRVVIHRIAMQVAAALKFLHNSGIIFCDLKASNVLLWSLDPESLCHCKVTDFGIATPIAPIGAKGVRGTKGFIAPEMLHIGKKTERAVYDHRVDIYSFGMLLYQMICNRNPFHDIKPVKIDAAILHGERPKFQDVPQTGAAYFYLTRLMQCCWQENPRLRPTIAEIIHKVCLYTFQSVMSVQPLRSTFPLYHACSVISNDQIQTDTCYRENEIWVCCHGRDGAELSTYATSTMTRVSTIFIKNNQVQYIGLHSDHVYVASRVGSTAYGVISIFSTDTRELIHDVKLQNLVTCMAASDQKIYCGTMNGQCLSFSSNVSVFIADERYLSVWFSEYAVNGILATKDSLWLSQGHNIFVLNLETLGLQCTLVQDCPFVGQLHMSFDGNTVWSTHLLSSASFTVWDALHKSHIMDVDVKKCMIHKHEVHTSLSITAMTPALDTVWVGMSTGHIHVFSMDKLLMWFHPYNEYVHFLVCMPCKGPCHTEKAMVVSGGKGFNPVLVPDLPDYEKTDEKGVPVDKAGTLIIWEAFPSKMCQQMTLMQAKGSSVLNNHSTVRKVLSSGCFKNSTSIENTVGSNGASIKVVADTPSYEDQSMPLH